MQTIASLVVLVACVAVIAGWVAIGTERIAYAARITFACVIGFVASCAGGATLEVKFGLWALTLPVVLSAFAVPLGRVEN